MPKKYFNGIIMYLKNVKISVWVENINDVHCEKQVDTVTLFCIPWMEKWSFLIKKIWKQHSIWDQTLIEYNMK